MRAQRATTESPTADTSPYTTTRTLDFWRLLRLVCGVQGAYYLINGVWLLLDRFVALPGPYSVTHLAVRAFGTDLIVALTALIGLVLLVSASRVRPDGLFTSLGLGAAFAFLIVGWRYRGDFSGWIYLELAVELLFGVALALTFAAAVIGDRRRR